MEQGPQVTVSKFYSTYKFHILILALALTILYSDIITDMARDWYTDDNYSHGFLVPLISGYFFWQVWPEIHQKTVKPCTLGLTVIFWGILQLIVSFLCTEYFSMRTSLIVLLAGSCLFLLGIEIFKKISLPLGYLFFMVPIPYILFDSIAFPLKLFVTKISVGVLKLAGVVVVREGNIIILPSTALEVANACSGIRSLVSLFALSVAYSFFLVLPTRYRISLIFSALPIAVLANSLRVIITGFLAQWWGKSAAEGFFHEFAGVGIFIVAIIFLCLFGNFLLKLSKYRLNSCQ